MLSEPLLLKQVIPNANLLFLKATPITRLFTRHSATRAFSAKKNLIEVVFPRATIGKNGPAAVEAVIEHADEDKMVVVSLFDYDWTATKKDWFNHLMKSSVCIRTDPIDRNALPRWITERAKEKNGQTLTPEAANLIAERTEGNLLATSQEIQKLALLVNKPEIDVSDVLDAVSDVSRFDQESLFLAMLEGDAGQVSKIYRFSARGKRSNSFFSLDADGCRSQPAFA